MGELAEGILGAGLEYEARIARSRGALGESAGGVAPGHTGGRACRQAGVDERAGHDTAETWQLGGRGRGCGVVWCSRCGVGVGVGAEEGAARCEDRRGEWRVEGAVVV